MCEYCGCQQVTVVEQLTREHDAVVAVVGVVRHALDEERLDDVVEGCRRLVELLGPHTVVEEEGLFPLMVEDFPDHVQALEREHRDIEEVLAEADSSGPYDGTWPDRLRHSLFVLREHILKEQDGVFPAALGLLDGEQWERVDDVRRRVGSALDSAHGSAGRY